MYLYLSNFYVSFFSSIFNLHYCIYIIIICLCIIVLVLLSAILLLLYWYSIRYYLIISVFFIVIAFIVNQHTHQLFVIFSSWCSTLFYNYDRYLQLNVQFIVDIFQTNLFQLLFLQYKSCHKYNCVINLSI